MNRYDYIPRPAMGGWIMEVWKGKSYKGNIRKHRVTGRYHFFRGSRNVIRPSLEESDIDTLIVGIEKLNM